MIEQRSFSLKEASKMLGVSTKTLRRWDNAGKIKTFRTEGNHRRIYESEVLRLQRKPKTKNCVIYTRVSSRKQTADGNVERQKERLIEYAKNKGYFIFKVFCETASGLTNQELLTEIEKISFPTSAHPNPQIDIKRLYPSLPTYFRRSCINTASGMCKSYLKNRENFKKRTKNNKSKNPPSPPTPFNLPVLKADRPSYLLQRYL
jgi:excisionase family DNA binding protein